MDQGMGVYHLYGRHKGPGGIAPSPEHAEGLHHQDGADPFAPGGNTVIHGLYHLCRKSFCLRQKRPDNAVRFSGFCFQFFFKIH